MMQGSSLLASYPTTISLFIPLTIYRFQNSFKKLVCRAVYDLHLIYLHTKTLEYRIQISAHGVIKGYRVMHKVKCKCLIIHRGSKRWQLSIGRKSLKMN